MTQRNLLARLLSPAAFGLALLLFLLPFVAISCDTPSGRVEATFTGTDMLIGGDPDISGPEPLTAGEVEDLVALVGGDIDTEPWAVVAAVAILVGMAIGLVRGRLARHASASGLVVLAIALLVVAEVRSIDALEDLRRSSIRGALDAPPAGVTVPRYGFWLAIATLTVLGVAHSAALVRTWRERETTPADASDARTASDGVTDVEPIDESPPEPT